MKRKALWGLAIIIAVVVFYVILCMNYEAQGQEIYFDATVTEGHFTMKVFAETEEYDGTYGRVDAYMARLHAPYLTDSTIEYEFTGMSQMRLDLETTFPLPCVDLEEGIKVQVGTDTECYMEVAGADFTAREIR